MSTDSGNNFTQGTLRDMDLREYEIQGHKFRQRKPCFDYRIRIEQKKFTERYNKHQSEILKDTIREISGKISSLGGVFEKLTPEEIIGLFDKDNSESATKMDAFKAEKPELYFEFMSIIGDVVSKAYSAMELFVMDRRNLKDLFEVMLEGEISAINLNPDNKDEQIELDYTGILMLNDFFLSKNLSKN